MRKISVLRLRKAVDFLASMIRVGTPLAARRHQSLVLLSVAVALLLAPLASLSQIRRARPPVPPARASITPQGSESSILSSGQAPTGSGIEAPHEAKGPVYTEIPPNLPRRRQGLPGAPEVPVPQGKVWGAIPPPVDPPTESPDNVAPQAPNDMTYQVLHDISAAEVPTSQRSSVHEPSVGNMGNTIFVSANWYAARSTNGGSTFSYVSPSATFPNINGGFCCDQIVNYARNQDMMLWAVQYSRDASAGTLRIARAVGSAAVASNSWIFYDFDPQDFGFGANAWMDFPNMTVASQFLYCSSNVFDTVSGCPSACNFRGSVVWRIPLNELAAGGFINYNFFTRTDVGSPRCAEGAATTMYWATFQDTSTLRIHRWDDSSGTIFWDNIALNPFTFLNRDGVATSPDGTNWAARAFTKVLGASVTGGVLAFMWPAKQDGSFPYPYTVVGRFSQSTRALLTQQPVWNSAFAWLYMSASVNAVGNQAGLISFGGGSLFPKSAIWINDDVQSGFAPLNNYLASESTDGPNRNVWGDYLTVRPHKDFVNSWVAVTYYMTSGGDDEDTIGRYIWFGRERDLPGAGAGAGIDTIGLYNPGGSAYFFRNTNSTGVANVSFAYGPPAAGWIPLTGDWNGNGVDTIGLYNPSSSAFFLRNTNSTGVADISFAFGPAAGWIPLVGDWNGDGTDTVGLYNPATGAFFLRNSNSTGVADVSFAYGPAGAGWIPVVGDWDGNGTDTIALYNPAAGTFFLRNSNTTGVANVSFAFGPGGVGWRPLVGDWDGDGTDTIGLYNPGASTFFLRNTNTTGVADVSFAYGPAGAGWAPLVGDWDGL